MQPPRTPGVYVQSVSTTPLTRIHSTAVIHTRGAHAAEILVLQDFTDGFVAASEALGLEVRDEPLGAHASVNDLRQLVESLWPPSVVDLIASALPGLLALLDLIATEFADPPQIQIDSARENLETLEILNRRWKNPPAHETE